MPVPVHATQADLAAVNRVVNAAFADDPCMRWVFEPAADPAAALAELFDAVIGDYFWLGHLYVVSGLAGIVGAALWSPPERDALVGEDRVNELVDRLTPHLGDELWPRLGELQRMHDYRPAEPHLYLGVLAVEPAHQGRGHGAALLAPPLADCDRMGLLAHLESSNERNVSLYERHGFQVVDGYRCGGDGPPVTIMSRTPR